MGPNQPIRNCPMCYTAYIDLEAEPERFEEDKENKIKGKWQEGDGYYGRNFQPFIECAKEFIKENYQQEEYNKFIGLIRLKDRNILTYAATCHLDALIVHMISVFGTNLLKMADFFNGTTPLIKAISRSKNLDKVLTTVKTLLCVGAHPNMTDPGRLTPLWWAAHGKNYSLMNLLCLHGAIASPSLKNEEKAKLHTAKWLFFEELNVHLLFKGMLDSNSSLNALLPEIAREIVLKRIDLFKYRSFMEPCQPIRNYPMCSIPYIDLKEQPERFDENEQNKIKFKWQEGDGYCGNTSQEVADHVREFLKKNSRPVQDRTLNFLMQKHAQKTNWMCAVIWNQHILLAEEIIAVFGKSLLNFGHASLGSTPLLTAINYIKARPLRGENTAFQIVKTLLYLGAHPSMANKAHETPLWMAIKYTNYFSLMKLLWLHGAVIHPALDKEDQKGFDKTKREFLDQTNIKELFIAMEDPGSSLNMLPRDIISEIIFKSIDWQKCNMQNEPISGRFFDMMRVKELFIAMKDPGSSLNILEKTIIREIIDQQINTYSRWDYTK